MPLCECVFPDAELAVQCVHELLIMINTAELPSSRVVSLDVPAGTHECLPHPGVTKCVLHSLSIL